MKNEEKPLRLIGFEASNVQCLKAVQIRADGHVVIHGKNRAGKSTILKSIWWALSGKKFHPDEPIRRGEKAGEVKLDLGEYLVWLRWTLNKDGVLATDLRVTNPDGARYSKPMELLKSLAPPIVFDPLEFAHLTPAKRLAQVMEFVDLPIDLERVANQRSALEEKRRNGYQELKRLEKHLESLPEPDEGLPTEEVSITALVDELRAVEKRNRACGDLETAASTTAFDAQMAESGVEQAAEAVSRAEAERVRVIREAEEALERAHGDADAQVEGAIENMEHAKRLRGDATDKAQEAEEAAKAVTLQPTGPIQTLINSAGETNERVRQAQHRLRTFEDLGVATAQRGELTENIRALDDSKAAALAEATWPVDGMGLADDGSDVTFEGHLFSQCSDSQQIRCGFGLATSRDPRLRIACTDRAESLDEDARAELFRIADEHDIWVWMAITGKGEPGDLIIEAGELIMDEQEKQEE